jgi:hypothetical protein
LRNENDDHEPSGNLDAKPFDHRAINDLRLPEYSKQTQDERYTSPGSTKEKLREQYGDPKGLYRRHGLRFDRQVRSDHHPDKPQQPTPQVANQ